MNRYITPNDIGVMAESDSQSIRNAVRIALDTGVRRVLIPRLNARTRKEQWDIDQAIILASNLEIVLDNCYLRQTDGSFDNVFRSFEDDSLGHTLDERLENVRIIGQGHPVIDGGLFNGLEQGTSLTGSYPHVSRNNMLLLWNMRGFVIENLHFRNQRWWTLNLHHCESGRISNCSFYCLCDAPNQDGIDLRVGCSDILIENITGQAGDDLIALSAFPLGGAERFRVEGHHIDIHDIVIRDVIGTSIACALIALRNTDGSRIYNITIDNIHDTDNGAEEAGLLWPDYPKHKFNFDMRRKLRGNSPYCLLRIGHYGYFKDHCNRPEETYNINATNLHSRGGGCVIMINSGLSNSYFGNIYAENDTDYIVTTKSGRNTQAHGADIRNVVFENIFYRNEDNDYATAFAFTTNDVTAHDYTLENVEINRAFLGNCKNIFSVDEPGNITYSGLHGKYVTESAGEIVNP